MGSICSCLLSEYSNETNSENVDSNEEEEQDDSFLFEPSNLYYSKKVEHLVLETLFVFRTLVEDFQEPPYSIIELHRISDSSSGWLQVMTSLMNVIPLDDPLGPSCIAVLLAECSNPSNETLIKFKSHLSLESPDRKNIRFHRNLAIILACLAEKLAGRRSVEFFTSQILEYLTFNLRKENDLSLILFSLIAIEKFSETSENKLMVERKLNSYSIHPLVLLESLNPSENSLKKQVVLVAQWFLDNLIPAKDRTYSYISTNVENINVMLNGNDVSEYLKIAPNGLQARCDASSFESVRCTFQVNSGIWFYEVTLVTSGIMQIGWATKDSKFLNHEGYGIGDDDNSVAYDGCRQLIWYNAIHEVQKAPVWSPGDVIGCLINLEDKEIVFYINGKALPPFIKIFESGVSSGFFAAASFMSFQQCSFNFGAEPFQFPPPSPPFSSFNYNSKLDPKDKVIYPRKMKNELLNSVSFDENACLLCVDRSAKSQFLPCAHTGICYICASELSFCPLCRGPIIEIVKTN